jgi:hypothetical protein
VIKKEKKKKVTSQKKNNNITFSAKKQITTELFQPKKEKKSNLEVKFNKIKIQKYRTIEPD